MASSKPVNRATVDLTSYPDLIAIYLGMTVQSLKGLKTLFGVGPLINKSVAAKPDGLVPVSTLPDDQYEHREKEHALVGRRLGKVYRLGASVKVKLTEADPVLGSTLFALLEPDDSTPEWLRKGGGGQMARKGRAKGSRTHPRGR
jgi:ribonuclease R